MMMNLLKSAAVFAAMATAVSAGVTSSSTAPSTDVLATETLGSTGTNLFTLSANDNHARGQLFSLGDGTGSAYEITAITVQKNTAQTYVNDTITLRVFEGTEAEWTIGTGHTSSDASFYNGTTVTPLHTEEFTLNGTYANGDFVTFELATPLVVPENSDFGFFLTYDPVDGSETAFAHLEGSSGGRISVTTASHAVSTRSMNYFVQGTAVNGSLTVSATEPSTDILDSLASGSTYTRLFDEDQNANHGRGQLFALPDGSGLEYQITAITVQKNGNQTFDNDTLSLRIFEGTQAQWDTGTGHSTADDGDDYYVDTTVTPLYAGSFALDGTISNGEFVTFELAAPITVSEDSDFGFLMTYDQSAETSPTYFQHNENGIGGRISVTTAGHGTSTDRGIRYYIQGTTLGTDNALKLGSPFRDRMVLQRDKAVNVWGEATALAEVSVSINGSTVTGTADENGDWKVELPSMAAGGPYVLEVTSGLETETVSDVLVGDVWFCFGQSNMVYTLGQMAAWADDYETAIAANDNVRCLKIDQDASLSEEDSAGMSWLANSTASSWTAVGSVFALQQNQATGVPVAIVWAAYGSSSIEGWMPLELSGSFPHFDEMLDLYQSVSEYRSGDTLADRAANLGYSSNLEAISGIIESGWTRGNNNADIFIRTRPNILYNKMVHPMRRYGISGFIWYQGEANSGTPDYSLYGYILPKFITEYRERFDQGDLPFLGVQLPSYTGTYWAWFRESQDQIRSVNNGHVAVTIDTGSSSTIHPTDKEPVGVRLSLLARKYALGEDIVADGPRFSSMSIDGSEVTLSFTHADGLKTVDRASPATFEIAGADEVFYDATNAFVSGTDVIVSSTSVPNPVAVRYAWAPVVLNDVNLVNGDGLPAAPFRTDDWELPDLGAQAPMGVNDSYEVERDATLDVATAAGVLANDIDLNRDAMTVTLVTDVQHGTLTLLADGSFSYVPESGFAGTDSFTYYGSDGALNSPDVTVTLTVTGEPSAYYSWKSGISWGAGDDDSASGDPDQDGVENLMEYALGLDPLVAGRDGLPVLTANGDDYDYSFNNVREGITYRVQLSTDLVSWSDPAFATLTSADATPVTIPASEAANGVLFVRLEVSE